MITVRITMKFTGEPLKRVPVTVILDESLNGTKETYTDRTGTATFNLEPASGKILVDGIARYHGRLLPASRLVYYGLMGARY